MSEGERICGEALNEAEDYMASERRQFALSAACQMSMGDHTLTLKLAREFDDFLQGIEIKGESA